MHLSVAAGLPTGAAAPQLRRCCCAAACSVPGRPCRRGSRKSRSSLSCCTTAAAWSTAGCLSTNRSSRSSFTPQVRRTAGATSTRTRSLAETSVEFANHRGEVLVGVLTDPSSVTAAAAAQADAAGGSATALQHPDAAQPPVVLLVHGYMSDHSSELLVRLSTALVRSCQLSTLRFDLSGNGLSQGVFRYGQYMCEAQQIGAAKRFLEARGRRVGAVVGHSKGATDALLFAGRCGGQYGAVPCIVNLAGRLDVRQGVEQRLGSAVLARLQRDGQVEMQGRNRSGPFSWTLRQEDVDDRLATDVAAACGNIPASTAVLTVHGTGDADVPVGDAKAFAGIIPNHKLVLLDGADHTFSNEGAFFRLAAAVLPFVHEHCNIGSDGQPPPRKGLFWLGG